MSGDPRYEIKKPTVRQIAPSSIRPKKRLSHSSKPAVSSRLPSLPRAIDPIVRRAVLPFRRGR